MASIAYDSTGTADTAKPPISAHPAFPAVVALWFAALLGIGSMVLPVVLIERVVELTGISALVPAAAPPLGLVARSLIALASALAGAAIGLAIARRIGRAHHAERPSRAAKLAKGTRRPIDVNEELGGEGLVNGFGLALNRRRALAIAEDDRPSDFLYMAPLPGDGASDDPLAPVELPAAPVADEPLELSDALEDSEIDVRELADDGQATPDEDAPMSFTQEFAPLSPAPPAEPGAESLSASTEPLPFAAPSLARRAPLETVAPEPKSAPAMPVAYEPPAPESEPTAAVPQSFAGDRANAPLDEPDLVQLVERLGASLERRREQLAALADSARLLAPAAGFDPAPAEEAAEAMAAYFNRPTGDAPAATAVDGPPETSGEPEAAPFATPDLGARPSLRGAWPAADDDDDSDDAVPSFTLPLRKSVSQTLAFDDHEAPENDDDIEDADDNETYSSLLAMHNPFTARDHGFVRVEAPDTADDSIEPAVVFPGHRESAIAGSPVPRAFDPPVSFDTPPAGRVPASRPDTDAALRAALGTLQRMSGSA